MRNYGAYVGQRKSQLLVPVQVQTVLQSVPEPESDARSQSQRQRPDANLTYRNSSHVLTRPAKSMPVAMPTPDESSGNGNGDWIKPFMTPTEEDLSSPNSAYSIERINDHYHVVGNRLSFGKKHEWARNPTPFILEQGRTLNERRKSMGDMQRYMKQNETGMGMVNSNAYNNANVTVNNGFHGSGHHSRSGSNHDLYFNSSMPFGLDTIVDSATSSETESESESDDVYEDAESFSRTSSDIDSSAEVGDADLNVNNFLSVSPISTNPLTRLNSRKESINMENSRMTRARPENLAHTHTRGGVMTRGVRIGNNVNVNMNAAGDKKSDNSNSSNGRELEKNRNSSVGVSVVTANANMHSQAARIRRGYLDRLGIASAAAQAGPNNNVTQGQDSKSTMGIHARRAAMASARARRKPPSMVQPLKEPNKGGSSFGQSLMKRFSSWMGSDYNESSDSKTQIEGSKVNRNNNSSSAYENMPRNYTDMEDLIKARTIVNRATYRKAQRMKAQRRLRNGKKSVGFLNDTHVYFVPCRFDIAPRNRARIWHTREEFIEMVMRNMDEVEEEMQQQMEIQARLADIRNNPPPSLNKKKGKNSITGRK